jgi:hypothetical protein
MFMMCSSRPASAAQVVNKPMSRLGAEARRVRCDSTPIATFGLLSMQFEAVNGNVMVGTSPVYETVADGDVRAQRKYVTRVVDYSNRIGFERSYSVGSSPVWRRITRACFAPNR